ncbi:interferon-like [Lonchura striata]
MISMSFPKHPGQADRPVAPWIPLLTLPEDKRNTGHTPGSWGLLCQPGLIVNYGQWLEVSCNVRNEDLVGSVFSEAAEGTKSLSDKNRSGESDEGKAAAVQSRQRPSHSHQQHHRASPGSSCPAPPDSTRRPSVAVPTATQPHSHGCRTPHLLLLLACQRLWTHDDTFPGDALRLLQDMPPSHTQPCRLQEPPFFPDTLLHPNLGPHQAAATALRILQRLFHTLSSNSTRQHWPSHARNLLLNKLQHHIHHLEQRLPDNALLSKGPRSPRLAINKYFRDTHPSLHTHSHSAWDHLRLEARASLRHLHNLTRARRR